MAAITLTEVKTYLGISGSTYDEKINLLIPWVQDQLFNGILHRDFLDSNGFDRTPVGVKITLSQMINFHVSAQVNTMDSQDKILQSVGDLTYKVYTGADNINGYPKSIINPSVLRYRKTSKGWVVGIDGITSVYIPNSNIELTGDIDGSNTEFTSAYDILANTETIFIGQLVAVRDVDYTILNNTITFTNAPYSGETLRMSAWVDLSSAYDGSYSYRTNITLTGDINGSNKTFTTTYDIKEDTEDLYVGQIKAVRDVDYTISGSTITFVVAPQTGETLTMSAHVK